MKIDELLKQVIPPNDHAHRHGFYNVPIIDKLGEDIKSQLETELIRILKQQQQEQEDVDMLIVETLSYLKSRASLPVLYELLNSTTKPMLKLMIAASIFKINQDSNIIEIAKFSCKQITNKNHLLFAMAYLSDFPKEHVEEMLYNYTKDSDYLVSYNAQKGLERVRDKW